MLYGSSYKGGVFCAVERGGGRIFLTACYRHATIMLWRTCKLRGYRSLYIEIYGAAPRNAAVPSAI